MSNEEIRIGRTSDVAEGGVLVVRAAEAGWDVDIVVARSQGRFYALDDLCTHEGVELSDGFVEGGEIECSAHGARFSLCTGAALCLPARIAVSTHRVEARGDELWLFPGVPADSVD